MTGATTALVPAKHSPMGAGFPCAPSQLAAFDDHQRKAPATAPLSRGHHVHVVSNHNQKRVSPCLFAADASSLLNWRGVRLASFSRPHSHRSAPLLPAGRLVVPSAFASVRTITNSVRFDGCSRLRAHSQHEPLVNRTSPAGRVHLPNVLSSSAAFAGSQTSEALNGRVPNSCGAFQKQEGELPNVRG